MEIWIREGKYILADPNGLEALFSNLITNALDAMPYGGELRIIIREMSTEEIEICFSDTGIGIPAEIQSHQERPPYLSLLELRPAVPVNGFS
jgi:signal transduction histidine kinase